MNTNRIFDRSLPCGSNDFVAQRSERCDEEVEKSAGIFYVHRLKFDDMNQDEKIRKALRELIWQAKVGRCCTPDGNIWQELFSNQH